MCYALCDVGGHQYFIAAGNIGLNWPTRYCTSELYGESPLIHKLGEVHCFYGKVKCVPQQRIDFVDWMTINRCNMFIYFYVNCLFLTKTFFMISYLYYNSQTEFTDLRYYVLVFFLQ